MTHPPGTRVRVPTHSGPQWGTVQSRRHGSLIDDGTDEQETP